MLPGNPSRALFLPHLDVLAHTGRSLLIAQRLRDQGWEAIFAGAGRYQRLVSEAGFECRMLPEMSAPELVQESRRGSRWPFHDCEQIRPFIRAELDLYRAVSPDVVVFDHRYTAGTSAEIAEIRRIAVTNVSWTPYVRDGMGLAETHPLFNRAPSLRFLRRFGWANSVGDMLANSMFRAWIKPYNEIRQEHGLGPLGSILDLFSGDAVILPDTQALTSTRPMPGKYHMVGPLVWEPEGELPPELHGSTGFIYISMGSSADVGIFDTIIEALVQLPEASAVITTAGLRSLRDFDTLGERVKAYDFLSGSAAIKGCDLVVCQGGIGTIYQALSAGKPVVGIPFMPEQEVYGSTAVERAGAGVSLSPYELTPAALAHTIRRCLSDTSISRAARALSDEIDLSSGPSAAAKVIVELDSISQRRVAP